MFKHTVKSLIGLATLSVVVSASASAAPYYRFWQGWKLDELSQEQFYSAINQTFIPITVKTGMGKSLVGYLPALPRKVHASIPDEIALVAYESEDVYKRLRETPEGKAYGELHWKFFDKNKGSRSSVPQPFQGKIEKQQAYDVLSSNSDWRRGYASYVMTKLDGNIEGYISFLRERAQAVGLASYLVLVSEDFFIEYQLWKDRDTFEKALKALPKLRERFSISKPFSGSYLRHSEQPAQEHLKEGKGINSWFSANQAKYPVINGDPVAYAEEKAAAYAEGVSDTTPFGIEGCEQVNNSSRSPVIDCHGTTTVLVFGGHPATSEFTCRYWFRAASSPSTYYFVKSECP